MEVTSENTNEQGMTTVGNELYAEFAVKYKLDLEKIHAGDYIDITVPEILSNVNLAVSNLHFEAPKNLGNGQYRLFFNENASNGISGSFSLSFKGTNTTEAPKSGVVRIGNIEKQITVTGKAALDTNSEETRAVVKYVSRSSSPDFQMSGPWSGTYDPTKDSVIWYLVVINAKEARMDSIVTRDAIPQPAMLNADSFKLSYKGVGGSRNVPAEEVQQYLKVNGNTWTYDASSRAQQGQSVTVKYSVTIPAQSNAFISNTATANFVERGISYSEKSTFTVKSRNGSSAFSGYKSVDRETLDADDSDQRVTYKLTFINDKPFQIGEINLDDHLNPAVTYVDSYGSDYFKLSFDEKTNTVHVTNVKPIPSSMEQSVTIATDFSKVPAGTTIENTVGGNTVKTKKEEPKSVPITKLEDPIKVPMTELVEPTKVPWTDLTEPTKVPMIDLFEPITVPMTDLTEPSKVPMTVVVPQEKQAVAKPQQNKLAQTGASIDMVWLFALLFAAGLTIKGMRKPAAPKRGAHRK